MTLRDLVKRILPAPALSSLRRARREYQESRIASLPTLDEEIFRKILVRDLGLTSGDTVFVHSSMDQLAPGFPFFRVLELLRQVVGADGTLLFPTYPQSSSYEFLRRGEVFDVRKSPSYTGILSEFARRQRTGVRSLHPTKSVCAIGPRAVELIADHQKSIYPYDYCSPYYKSMKQGGKILGLGVSTSNLSFVHCIDDELKETFPVRPYHSEVFAARCVNTKGQEEIVKTLAHDLRKMNHDIPRFMAEHIEPSICRDRRILGREFFIADAERLFAEMVDLARSEITIYPRSSYEQGRR
ncbi:MAG TPA: AAC(3) family N-acetyltransferase [Pyrinomonadaceae bacterium]|nr:AAC(3) family N-acetyltransferase [Pyrinomonadaceae bacterium]